MGHGVTALRRALLCCAAVAALAAAWAIPAAAAAPAAPAVRPVPSLTPAATKALWRQLVRRPPLQAFGPAQCRPLRAAFYAGTDWLRLATRLAATPSPCAQYLISVPPLTSDKSRPRPDQARRIRALGPSFHALAEINVTGWTAWVETTGNSWREAGFEARRRMAATGYDVAAGDTWALNELTSAVRQGTGTARADMRAFLGGLYEGDGTVPQARGVVFTTGIAQGTSELSVYQARLQDWYEDEPFWAELARTTSDWSQELYGDVRTYAVAGATPAARGAALNEYLQHQTALAAAAPGTAAAARAVLAGTSSPLANAAWQYDAAFGWTNVPSDVMQDYVSAQVYALRAAGNGRFGFAWAPRNLAALPAADFVAQTDAILVRLAAAIADSAAAPEAACAGGWCTRSIPGAAFTTRWRSFATWSPSALVFTTLPPALVAGAASPALTIELRTSTAVPYATGLPVPVVLTSSSPAGTFSTSPAGPWAPTLTVPIASGASTTSVYFTDTQPGSPTIVATATGKTGATLTATVSPPAGGTPPETTLGTAPTGVVASSSASIAFSSGTAGVRFECSLDGAPFATCTPPATVSGLADGPHVFDVRAIDAAGNTDPSPAHAAWTVDTRPPPTRITSGPRARTASTRATFRFLTEASARLECSLDGRAYARCRAAYSLRAGVHVLRARAVDAAGNVDATPARWTWTIDRTPPRTTITAGPRSGTSSRTATLYFKSNERGGTFRCSLDGRAFAPCRSPLRRAGFARGLHTLRVRAVDVAGNVDATPATYRWR